MRNCLLKKGLILGIIILFFGASVIPSTGYRVNEKSIKTISNGNTLYVGGTGTNNYTKIQDAIDNASDGDTVFVYDDSSPYYETSDEFYGIVIDKSINLIGEDKETTIIDGNKTVCYVITVKYGGDWVNISGFTIKNSKSCGFIGSAGIGLFGSHTIVSNNIITSNEYGGIRLESDSIIFGNIINNNEIGIWNSICNTITGNNISSNKYNGFIHHNNFLNNVENAYDVHSNSWDDGEYGNYWYDYNGTDSDGDGIGDTPYPIPPGDSEDRYPMMEPWPCGQWNNSPPDKPYINGSNSGKPDIKYNYTFVSIDPDGEDVCYYIDWKSYGDGFWTDWYASGEEVILPYSWPGYNTFTIKAKAKDVYGAESNWSEFEVEIEKSRNTATYPSIFHWLFERFPLLEKLLKIIRL